MAERTPTGSPASRRGPLAVIRALRLDAWRAASAEPVERLLGSLHPILGDFAPARPVAAIPLQRTAPDVTGRLRWSQ